MTESLCLKAFNRFCSLSSIQDDYTSTWQNMAYAMIPAKVPASFRDPSGFLFFIENEVYRQVNKIYKEDYDHFISSGLHETLVQSGLLIPHLETDMDFPDQGSGCKILKPEKITFISYPYEWCFSQLKDAALTTLRIQKTALDYGMSLKDASAYNIQFQKGRPVFIDTLSFEKYQEGRPWVAYRQFCQHFLAPLALMSRKDIRLQQLLKIHMDGVPLDLASSLLPFKTRFKYSLLTHIHVHARTQKRYAGQTSNKIRIPKLSRAGLIGIINSLESAINSLKWNPRGTEWSDYYQDTNYTPEGFEHKKQIVQEFLSRSNPATVWDVGSNTGHFSRLASDNGIQTIAFDVDPAAVEKNYMALKSNRETDILPLVNDLTNPSPGIGWQNNERMGLMERGPADTLIALALIHHLAVSNNLPFSKVADFMQQVCDWLIIEFVPKKDSQVQRLLATRDDIFPDYTQEAFEQEFGRYFAVIDKTQIKQSERIMYLMHKI